jgi:hypothetical protein
MAWRFLQDGIAQVGEGKIWLRQNEHLGRSDQGLIMRRRGWARELRALAEGRPLTPWQRPAWHEVQNWDEVAVDYAAKYGLARE